MACLTWNELGCLNLASILFLPDSYLVDEFVRLILTSEFRSFASIRYAP